MSKRSIDDILAADELIEDIPPAPIKPSSEERVAIDFEEISAFVDTHGHPPRDIAIVGSPPVSVSERMLAIRLKQYQSHPLLPQRLFQFDRHSLLKAVTTEALVVKTIDDVLAHFDEIDDEGDTDDLFVIRNVGRSATKDEPDFVADRTRCEDFDRFKPLLDTCADEIAQGKRQTRRFVNESEISKGDFYILNGLLVYVAEMDELEETGKTRRKNARLRVIYDNGTESALLFRSLARLLYRDPNGRRVTNPETGPLFDTTPEPVADTLTGYVYVAKAEPVPSAMKQFANLHKIGVTTGHPRARIAGAVDDPTFLFSKAVLLKHYAIYNVSPRQIEAKLHAFLAGVCLDIEIEDRFKRPYRPKEWFLVPTDILDEIVMRVIDGTIAEYRYDRVARCVVKLQM